jgi:hypothetical protein
VRHFGQLVGASLMLVFVLVSACGDDHSRLAKTEVGGGGSAEGGSGGLPSSSSSGGFGGTGGIEEPPGPTRLTLVNGIVDTDAVRLCFMAHPTPSGGELPWPSVQGLPFARAATIDPIFDVVPDGTDVELWVVAGNLAATGGVSCADLIATPPTDVQVRSLAVVPESALLEEKSVLLVPSGCVGGPGHTDAQEETICGPGYSETNGNATLVAGFMSRLGNLSKVSLQFVHASAAMPDTVLRLAPAISSAAAQLVVGSFSFGAIAPFPPYMVYATAQLNGSPDSYIELTEQNQSQALATVTFPQAFAASTLSLGDMSDGDNLVFVGVGAAPPLASGAWWNAFTFTVVDGDP